MFLLPKHHRNSLNLDSFEKKVDKCLLNNCFFQIWDKNILGIPIGSDPNSLMANFLSCETLASKIINQGAKFMSTERCLYKIYSRNVQGFIKFVKTRQKTSFLHKNTSILTFCIKLSFIHYLH